MLIDVNCRTIKKIKLQRLFSFFTQRRDTKPIHIEEILWNNRPIEENSVLLWDLENIPFHRLEDIKRVAKFTPQELYIVSKQHLGDKLLQKIYREHFKVLNAHKGISDSKIISIMKLYKDKEHMILVSSDSDFAKEANNYLKKGRLQWIVVDNVKKGVIMHVNLASKNLTLSTLDYKPSKQSVSQKHYYKTMHRRAHRVPKRGKISLKKKSVFRNKIENQISLYINSYILKQTRLIKRVKKLYKKVRYHLKQFIPIRESQSIQVVNPNNPLEGKRDIYRRNFRGKRVRTGTLQFRKDGKSILSLYKNLLRKYEIPQFEKHVLFYEFEEIAIYIHFNVQEQEYYLNDFLRKSNEEII